MNLKENIMKNFPDFETFKNMTLELIEAISKVWNGPDRPKDYDLHEGNIGFKNGKLVFLICMLKLKKISKKSIY